MKKFLLSLFTILVLSGNSWAAVLCPNVNGGVPYSAATLEVARTSLSCKNGAEVTSVLTEAQSNITAAWPSDRSLKVEKGGSIANSTALTINGPFIAGLYQTFSGSGVVTFSKGSIVTALPEWWGDYSTTVVPIQLAIDSYSSVTLSGKACVPDMGIFINKSAFILDMNYAEFDMTGKTFPLVNIGVKPDGTISDTTNYDMNVINLNVTSSVLYGTAGSHGVRFGRSSNSRVIASHIYGVQYGVSSMTKDYSLGAIIRDCDIRGNNYGIYDALGAFQGGAVIGGRIEQNKYNGVYTKTDNWILSNVIIEGNGQAGTTIENKAEIWAGQLASLTLTGVYSETIHSAQPIIYVPVSAAATQIHILGGSYYGLSGESLGVLIHTANTTTEQSYTVSGANIRNMAKIVNVVTPSTGIYARIDVDDRSSSMNPSTGLSGCTYYIISKNKGIQTSYGIGDLSNYIPFIYATYMQATSFKMTPVAAATSTNAIYVDSADNLLKFKNNAGQVKVITVTP